jgi:hypothetical protein
MDILPQDTLNCSQEDLLTLALWCAEHCPELVTQWERVFQISLPKSTIASMIDKATGKDVADGWKWVAFVKEFVWDRLPREFFEEAFQ